jgi:hypothetical protein
MNEMVIKQSKDGKVVEKRAVTSEKEREAVVQEMKKSSKGEEQVKVLKRV